CGLRYCRRLTTAIKGNAYRTLCTHLSLIRQSEGRECSPARVCAALASPVRGCSCRRFAWPLSRATRGPIRAVCPAHHGMFAIGGNTVVDQRLLAIQHPFTEGFEIEIHLLCLRKHLIFFFFDVMADAFCENAELGVAVIALHGATVQLG